MIGIYFSGTGNTKYCTEKFLDALMGAVKMYSIEDNQAKIKIKNHTDIVFSYPIQYSNLPKIVRDFIINNSQLWQGKNIYIIVTMGLFSGDGAGLSARLLKKYGANIVGGLHLKMPDCIGDVKILKKSLEQNKVIVRQADQKVKEAVEQFKLGTPTREGLSVWYHLAGLLGQRLYFYNKTKNYSDKIRINHNMCIGCGKCVSICPMKNLELKSNQVVAKKSCTMCYRCISNCPKSAITLIGKEVIEQCKIERYL